jgi:hypothetical protein
MMPDDVKRRMMSNPEVLKAQATQTRIAQLHQGKKELSAQEHEQKLAEIDAKGLAGAGSTIVTKSLERAAEREEMQQISGSLAGV